MKSRIMTFKELMEYWEFDGDSAAFTNWMVSNVGKDTPNIKMEDKVELSRRDGRFFPDGVFRIDGDFKFRVIPLEERARALKASIQSIKLRLANEKIELDTIMRLRRAMRESRP